MRVYGPPREHPPPHVHVERGSDEVVVIRLGLKGSPPTVWAVYEMKDRDVVKAFRIVEQNQDALLDAWRALHGEITND